MKNGCKKKIVVAMSGGVDSSVAAALLKRQSCFVIGVFMKFWKSKELGEKRAKQVAKKLDIPFYIVDCQEEFKSKVVDYFLAEYKKGNTPNPCVVCNKEIKFKLLIKKALSLSADFVATGHYARAKEDRLLEGKNKDKDQSYFLWQLNQRQLKRILFPLGNYTKTEVRKLAKKFKLPTAEARESQEVCFVSGATSDFLKKYLKTKAGDIINVNGQILGEHAGLWFYTIGQRKGIGLSGGPYYVVGKDLKKNLLVVSKDKNDLLKKELVVKNVNWVSGKEPKLPMKIKARIRYRHKLTEATVSKIGVKRYKLVFVKPQQSITPGQSAVFYEDEGIIGGGIME